MEVHNIDDKRKGMKYSIAYLSNWKLFENLKNKNTLHLSKEAILQYLQAIQQIFKSFSKNWRTFDEAIEQEAKNLGQEKKIFKNIISTLLNMRNYCNQFDMIFWKNDWERVCKDSMIMEKKHKGKQKNQFKGVIFKNESSEKILTEIVYPKSRDKLLKIYYPRNLTPGEIFRRIRNWIAHWDASIIIWRSGYYHKIIIDREDIMVEIDPIFFVSWITFQYNSQTRDRYQADVLGENKFSEDVKWKDEEIDYKDNDFKIGFWRYKNKEPTGITYWECLHNKWKFENFINYKLDNPNFFRKEYIRLDNFQMSILKEQLKDYEKRWTKITRWFIHSLLPFIYYWTSNNGNQTTLVLNNYISDLCKNGNAKYNDKNLDFEWIKKQRINCKHFGERLESNHLILENMDNVLKRQYIKYFFTKQERPWNDDESKICRHLRNCFIHEYYTHLPVNEIGFQDHPRNDESEISFLWYCKIDKLYEKILNNESIYNIFTINHIK